MNSFGAFAERVRVRDGQEALKRTQPHLFVVDRLAPMLQERIPDALHITRAYECPEKIRRQFKPIRLNGRIESFRKLGPKLRVADHMLPVAMRTVALALGE